MVVDREIAKEVLNSDMSALYNNRELFNLLADNNFFAARCYKDNIAPKEYRGFIWDFIRVLLIAMFIGAIITILVNIKNNFVWNSLNILSFKTNFLYLFAMGILFSFITTILHECMHMIFANNINNIKGALNLSIKKSTAYVSLTHIWTWTLLSRIIAISAGVILDTILLAGIVALRTIFDSEILELFSIIMFLRIIWQLRFHKNSDGKYFIMMLIDNPFIDIDYKYNRYFLNKYEKFLWKTCLLIGGLVDFYLLIFWLIPFLYQLCLLIGVLLCWIQI